MVLLAVDISTISETLTTVVTGLESTQPKLAEAGSALMQKLGLIEVALALLWCMFQGESIKSLVQKALGLAVWMTIITNFHELAKGATKWLVNNAAAVAGLPDPWELVLNPAKIMELGTIASEPLMAKVTDVSLVSGGDTIVLGLCALLLVLAFIFLAVHVAFSVVEFYLYLNVSALLLPFAALHHTRFIADKAINAVLHCAIKLAVVTYIMAVLKPVLESVELAKRFGQRSEDLQWNEIFALLLISAFCLLLAIMAPRMAAGLMHGSPSLSGTGVVLGAMSAAVGAAQVAYTVGSSAVQKAFSAGESAFGAIGPHLAPAPASPPSSGGGAASVPAAPPPPPSVAYIFFGDQSRLGGGGPSAPMLEARNDDEPSQRGFGGDPQLPAGDVPRLPSGGDAPRLPRGDA